jgi:L-aspartate oxidase
MIVVDFLVIGGGIAGLRAAAGLAGTGSVLVVTKESATESNTAYAQGGIAVALGGVEDVALHLSDTIAAGDGLVDARAAAVLVEQGPQRVEELLRWGTGFDRHVAGELMRTREGAHSLPRILHAHGDGTGREIAVSLLQHVRGLEGVEWMEWTTSVDLVVEAGRVVGAMLLDAAGDLTEVRAGAVLLASGGAGQLFSETTNPAVATGDGMAMAYRAGAELMDMEFCQFHPTAFAVEGAPRFLMSEALRGEGAWLVNARGERFMGKYHAGMELAPRDVVARAIARERRDGPVYLDCSEGQGKAGQASEEQGKPGEGSEGRGKIDWTARFPGISDFLKRYELELGRDLIPVSPAAHYMMGGVRTDARGRTSLPGLYAAGEVASTGVHGANRLASNSLLEGLVFGALAAEAMVEEEGVGLRLRGEEERITEDTEEKREHRGIDGGDEAVEGWIAELRGVMWRDAGLLRDGMGLRRAQAALEAMRLSMPAGVSRRAVEARNLHLVAQAMVQAALGREESRGAHFRSDFPERDAVGRHSVLRCGELWFVD